MKTKIILKYVFCIVVMSCMVLSASEPVFKDGKYLMILEGKTSIAQALPVNAEFADNVIDLSVDTEGAAHQKLKKGKNGEFTLSLDDLPGKFDIKAKLTADSTLEGSFKFKPSKMGKELFNGKYPQKTYWDREYDEHKKTNTWVKDLRGRTYWIRNSKLDTFKAKIKHYTGKETVE